MIRRGIIIGKGKKKLLTKKGREVFFSFFSVTGVNKLTRKTNFYESKGVNIFPLEIIKEIF